MPPKGSRQVEDAVAVEEIVFERTEQEEQCDRIFKDLDKAFKKLNKLTKPDKIHGQIKSIVASLKEAKALIKDFEREARADNMSPGELAARKKVLVSQLNGYIEMKKAFEQAEGSKADLMTGAQGEVELGLEGMSMQALMNKGRKDMKETDEALNRAQRIVEDTKEVGRQVAATVGEQTKKMEDIMDKLNDMEFTMKKASKVIRDITRGLLTDKCIAFLLLLVVVGVVAIIVVKIIKPNHKKVVEGAQAAISNITSAINSTSAGSTAIGAVSGAASQAADAVSSVTGRRLLLEKALRHVLELNATL
ncbi:hypothetical protein Agub_g12666 [Astrephomene gubernaculifera]|uniref:t-SNARE coiled-coil homology domain-containing protein n=1 Tax=Astrephomene gubernaculifera TaxID=47775 RepID=A0AAD3DYM8_9CHLO|nr:hypothetical protein Agub_g12666 [Astrephomene gubernaculifera]